MSRAGTTICRAIVLAFAVMQPFPLRAEPPPSIRVLVIDSVPSITVQGMGGALRIAHPQAREEERLGAAARITAGKTGLILNGADRGLAFVVSCSAGRYRVGERSFRGSLMILWKEAGKLMVVDTLPLEDYLAGLINSEISSSWPPEAIKAQAVAARTYAMNQVQSARRNGGARPYDITATTLDQVYDGAHQEDLRSHDAVAATRGQLLLRRGEVFPAYYHSCCGGRTEHAHNVWAGEEGPPPIDDASCSRSPKLLWSYAIPLREFVAGLSREGISVRAVRSVATSALTDSPRVDTLLIEDDDGMRMVKATALRRIFGYQNIKSTWFEAALKRNEILFTGRGYGHGVGLCQWGAKGMAEDGNGYREILKSYYPDAEVGTLY